MKRPPSSRPIDLKRIPAALAILALPAACAERGERIAVCPLRAGAAEEAAPAGFAAVDWGPVGRVHFPTGWQARVGPHGEDLLSLSSPDGTAELRLEAACCGGSDLPRSASAGIESWSGRTFWTEERREGSRVTQRYFSFPFAHVDAGQLRDRRGAALRPPIGLSVTASCSTAAACADVRAVVRSIRYDGEATRLAQQGDERVARLGAAATRRSEPAPPPATAPGGRPPPPAPPPPEPLFTPESCPG
jgi:hypothetical protein